MSFVNFYKWWRESEFAAWTLVYGYTMNHLAFAVHRLKHRFSDIKCVKEYFEENGFELNKDGGVLKGFLYLFFTWHLSFRLVLFYNHYLSCMEKYFSEWRQSTVTSVGYVGETCGWICRRSNSNRPGFIHWVRWTSSSSTVQRYAVWWGKKQFTLIEFFYN